MSNKLPFIVGIGGITRLVGEQVVEFARYAMQAHEVAEAA
jgi:xanthosine utilization system XapX-like protein